MGYAPRPVLTARRLRTDEVAAAVLARSRKHTGPIAVISPRVLIPPTIKTRVTQSTAQAVIPARATLAVTATTDDTVSIVGVSSALLIARRTLVVQTVTQATVKSVGRQQSPASDRVRALRRYVTVVAGPDVVGRDGEHARSG